MRKHMILSLVALASFGLLATSCSDDDDNSQSVPEVTYGVTLSMPLNVSNPSLESATVVLTNVTTQKEYTANTFTKQGEYYVDSITVPEGTYNIDVQGQVSYEAEVATGEDETETVAGERTVRDAKASRESVAINALTAERTDPMALNIYVASSGLVISEIFFTGTLTEEGKQYSDDQYFKIANNSDTVMYLDGVAFLESDFLTVSKYDYTPNKMPEAFSIDAIYVFPGTGKDYPIQPGQEVTVAINAVDHTELNPLSFDLSKADFEIYDESSNPNFMDTQNPNVPDMVNWYDYSYTYFSMHNRGFHSYAIARPQVDKETFLRDYFYQYTYVFSFGEYTFDMEGEAYYVPNSWILDAVNLSVADVFEWIVTSPSLDAGWAHCGSVDHDQNRYNKAVVRKQENGKWIDTNNSTNDFESDATPSLLRK